MAQPQHRKGQHIESRLDSYLPASARTLHTLVALLISLAYIVFELIMAPQAPFADDYRAIIQRYIDFQAASTYSEFFQVLLEKHNVHHLIVSNALVAALAYLDIAIDFYWLVMLGIVLRTLSFWLVIGIFLQTYRREANLGIIVLVGAIFFFQIKSWHPNNFAMLSLCGNFAWFFGLAGIFIANTRQQSYLTIVLSMLLAFMAAIRHTTGIPAIVPVAVLLLIHSSSLGQRSLVLVLLFAQVSVTAYLIQSSLQHFDSRDIQHAYETVGLIPKALAFIEFSSVLLGNFWTSEMSLAKYVGALAILGGALLLIKYVRSGQYGMLAALAFAVGALATIVYGRYSLDLELASAPRYLMFTDIFWLIFGLMIIVELQENFPKYNIRLLYTLLAGAFFITGVSYGYHTPQLEQFRQKSNEDIARLALGVSGLLEGSIYSKSLTRQALLAQRKGILDFSRIIDDFNKPVTITDCSSGGYIPQPNLVYRLGKRDYEARYVRFEARGVGGKDRPDCVFRTCASSPIYSLQGYPRPQESGSLYYVSVVTERTYRKLDLTLMCK